MAKKKRDLANPLSISEGLGEYRAVASPKSEGLGEYRASKKRGVAIAKMDMMSSGLASKKKNKK